MHKFSAFNPSRAAQTNPQSEPEAFRPSGQQVSGRHLIPPVPKDRRGLVVFPVRVKNGEFCSATQEPRSGNFLIPLLPLSYSPSCALKHHTARGRPTPPTMETLCFANTAEAVGAYLPGGDEPQARNHADRLFPEKNGPMCSSSGAGEE